MVYTFIGLRTMPAQLHKSKTNDTLFTWKGCQNMDGSCNTLIWRSFPKYIVKVIENVMILILMTSIILT